MRVARIIFILVVFVLAFGALGQVTFKAGSLTTEKHIDITPDLNVVLECFECGEDLSAFIQAELNTLFLSVSEAYVEENRISMSLSQRWPGPLRGRTTDGNGYPRIGKIRSEQGILILEVSDSHIEYFAKAKEWSTRNSDILKELKAILSETKENGFDKGDIYQEKAVAGYSAHKNLNGQVFRLPAWVELYEGRAIKKYIAEANTLVTVESTQGKTLTLIHIGGEWKIFTVLP